MLTKTAPAKTLTVQIKVTQALRRAIAKEHGLDGLASDEHVRACARLAVEVEFSTHLANAKRKTRG